MPVVMPAEVRMSPSSTNRRLGSTSTKGWRRCSSSVHRQWVVAGRRSSNPAAATANAPVQIETRRAPRPWASRTASSTAADGVASRSSWPGTITVSAWRRTLSPADVVTVMWARLPVPPHLPRTPSRRSSGRGRRPRSRSRAQWDQAGEPEHGHPMRALGRHGPDHSGKRPSGHCLAFSRCPTLAAMNEILVLLAGPLADASLAIARASESQAILDHSIRSSCSPACWPPKRAV